MKMKKNKVQKILEMVAAANGVSVMEVRRDMQEALDEGMKSEDPEVQEYWKSIPCRGEKPTLEETIVFLGKQANKSIMLQS